MLSKAVALPAVPNQLAGLARCQHQETCTKCLASGCHWSAWHLLILPPWTLSVCCSPLECQGSNTGNVVC
jgi:hypothetical protein